MASKGQKLKKYSIEEYNKGISSSYLEKEYVKNNNKIS